MNNIDFVNGSLANIPWTLTHFSEEQLNWASLLFYFNTLFFLATLPQIPLGGFFYKNVVKIYWLTFVLVLSGFIRLLLSLCCHTSERDKLFQSEQEL